DFRLNPDNDRFRTAEADDMGNLTQRSGGERIHDVHGRHIHNDPARTEPHYLLHQRAAQLVEVCVGKGRLKRRNQDWPLLKNWNFHVALFSWRIQLSSALPMP